MPVNSPTVIATDRVIIVGAGLGALYAALKLAPRPVLMISPEALGQGASSAWAQGGVAAAMDAADSPEKHAADTVGAGAGTVDASVAAHVTSEARRHILDLTTLGTPFDRDADGGYVLNREAAHSLARVVRVKGDQAGAEIMKALISEIADTPSVQVLEGVLASGLEVKDKWNPQGDIELHYSGLRPGEKLYEELLIGEGSYETDHERINKANEIYLPWEDMIVLLDNLDAASDSFDVKSIQELLRNAPTGYVPTSKLNDLFLKKTLANNLRSLH